MILHLENGGCVSEITTQDLYTTATRCYQSHKYIDRDYRADMLDGEDLEGIYTDTVGRTSPLVKQVQLYDVEQVANFRLLQIDRLLKAIVRAGYILLH
jgi:hypothetical protein